jgi:hypothetical protein
MVPRVKMQPAEVLCGGGVQVAMAKLVVVMARVDRPLGVMAERRSLPDRDSTISSPVRQTPSQKAIFLRPNT